MKRSATSVGSPRFGVFQASLTQFLEGLPVYLDQSARDTALLDPGGASHRGQDRGGSAGGNPHHQDIVPYFPHISERISE